MPLSVGSNYFLRRLGKFDVTRMTGRMSIVRKNVLDEFGQPWIGRGANNGHGELSIDTDCAEMASRGLNCIRIIPREWGTYQGVITDSYDATSSSVGKVNLAYLANIVKRCRQAKAAGLKVILALDSNCGQAERVGDMVCDMGTGSPQTFFTPGGAARRALHIASARNYARTLLGLVDFYEPLVEPFPSVTLPTGNVMADVQLFQDQMRNAILAEDPAALFIIGPAPGYQNGAVYNWHNPDWDRQSNTMYTCNLLDGAATDTVGLPARIQNLTNLRRDFKCPVFVQQVGTKESSDSPPYPLMANVLDALNTAAGGSIGWTLWEWCSAGVPFHPDSYGPYNSTGAPTRILNTQRMACLTTAATAPRFSS